MGNVQEEPTKSTAVICMMFMYCFRSFLCTFVSRPATNVVVVVGGQEGYETLIPAYRLHIRFFYCRLRTVRRARASGSIFSHCAKTIRESKFTAFFPRPLAGAEEQEEEGLLNILLLCHRPGSKPVVYGLCLLCRRRHRAERRNDKQRTRWWINR